jgi:Asp-tRNA(Asn)/Glu-tRNA(Gln) amidotransferase A subunit family amidase
MDASQLNWLSACDATRAIADGALSAEQLVEACLARITDADPAIGAWAYLDPEHARAQARAADAQRARGEATGPLHGIPVGIKDIFDTGDMPTEDGTVLHAGRAPAADAAAVAMLRAAGAVVMGKTVTTELATYSPGKTRNPHNPAHTPGGSSSGSAAAVAAGMVPLALGTQTNGSVIRPAAFCGVYGFKPTHGLIPRSGVLKLSRTLDHVGVFARSIEDVALISESLVGYDPADPDTRPRARPPFRRVATEDPPLPPVLAFTQTPLWERTDEDLREAFAELVAHLGDRVFELDLPGTTAQGLDWHRCIMEAEMAANLDAEWTQGRDRLSDSLRGQLERTGLSASACADSDDQRRLRGDLRALRRDPDSVGTRNGAGGSRCDRRSVVLHPVDARWHAKHHTAVDARFQRTAARRAADWSAGWRCALAAHRALACACVCRRYRLAMQRRM